MCIYINACNNSKKETVSLKENQRIYGRVWKDEREGRNNVLYYYIKKEMIKNK